MSTLSDKELEDLCGLRQGAAQARFLNRAYGLHVPRRPDGKVRVTWEVINHAVTAGTAGKSAPSARPNWTK